MSRLAVAEIPYLNCAPFYWRKGLAIPGTEIEWKWAHPRELGQMALRGEIDAGPVSLLNIPGLSENFDLLPFGITAVEDAGSVILFSKKPFSRLQGESVGLTPQSATSTELLRLILRETCGVEPAYHDGYSEADAARLLIGNQALFALLDPVMERGFPFRLDLGRAWKKWKGHSFVFARWMARKGLPAGTREGLEDWISENIRLYGETPAAAIGAFEEMRGWRTAGAEEYLSGFGYRTRESDYLGSLTTFSQFSSHLATSRI
ncbi:MAG: hypothetical protein A3A86_04475 [Elusimicrobia bacterium RIFCSPLOWO2_01_FULL_60_11]|nr:MAG: hypothetical protein A3A86_04475 [Elusimicrobia bacterium RIFCSPLOWO2_01_FULL_60_11]